MNEHDALIAGILAAPDSALPRLVYADWLEEHGGDPARAEFIRVQCEIAKLEAEEPTLARPRALIGQEIEKHVAREQQIFGQWDTQWSQYFGLEPQGRPLAVPFRGIAYRVPCAAPNVRWAFVRRGFVEELEGDLEWLIGEGCARCHGLRMIASHPWICPDCNSHGCVLGAVAQLRQHQPIRYVRASDLRPTQNDRYPWWEWHFTQIPTALYAKLKGDPRLLESSNSPTNYSISVPMYRRYYTQQEAYDDLSRAILS